MDCTYRVVPPNLYNFKLMIITVLDLNKNKNKTVLCSLILLMIENEHTFKTLSEIII